MYPFSVYYAKTKTIYLTHQMRFLHPSLFIIIILLVIWAKRYRTKPKILTEFWLKIPNVIYKQREVEAVMFTLYLSKFKSYLPH